jgi:hypothetical protein
MNRFLNQDMVTMKKMAFNIMDANGDNSICPSDLFGMMKNFRQHDYALYDDLGHIAKKFS